MTAVSSPLQDVPRERAIVTIATLERRHTQVSFEISTLPKPGNSGIVVMRTKSSPYKDEKLDRANLTTS